jgi:hypothetical protein
MTAVYCEEFTVQCLSYLLMMGLPLQIRLTQLRSIDKRRSHRVQELLQVIRWQQKTPPEEQGLRKQMQQEGLSPYAWSNGPGYYYAVHCHSYQKVLYCVYGSICFILPDRLDTTGSPTAIDLNPGDCLILPPDVRHSAKVSTQGVTCLEASRY